MFLSRVVLTFGWAMIASSTISTAVSTPDVVVSVRDSSGASSANTFHALRKSLVDIHSQRRDVELKNSTTLDKSWNNATLLSM